MSDSNPHHPGVRSLLAKFEGQSPIASPPSRGRSPATSDTSGTARQLSKVRASFVTVDGIIHSSPASPLRKTSGRSDSPGIFGPTINSEDVESGRQSTVSPASVSRLDQIQNATLGQILAEGRPSTETKSGPTHTANENHTTNTETASRLRNTSPKQTGGLPPTESKPTRPGPSSLKPDSPGIIKKKPSSVGSTRSSAGAKPSVNNTSPKLTAREVAKERSNSLAHRPSRVSLNPKTTARTARGATTAQDVSKPVTRASSKAGIKSSPRPARSATAQTSANRLASTGAPNTRTTTSSSTLARKPSSLKSAAGGQPRATSPVSSVRRQASRPSLPAQTGNDSSAKPVNEGFLARMMRPTASSASKSHLQEKADTKPVTKTSSSSKAPRLSIGRVSERGAAQVKPKSGTLRPQNQKSQAPQKEPALQKDGTKFPQKKQESEKENIMEPTPASPKEPAAAKSTPVIAMEQSEAAPEPVQVTPAPAQVEEITPKPTIASVESTEKPAEVPEPINEETVAESSPDSVSGEDAAEISTKPVDSNEVNATEAETDDHVEAPVEPIAEVVSEQAVETTPPAEETPAEPVATSTDNEVEVTTEKQDTSAPEPEVQAEVPEKDSAAPVSVEAAEEKSTDKSAPAVQPATEDESSNVAIDIANLALN